MSANLGMDQIESLEMGAPSGGQRTLQSGRQFSKAINRKRAAVFWIGLIILLIISSLAVMPRHGEVYNIVEVRQKLSALSKEKKESIDVMFVGDSEVYRSFSPLQLWKELGMTSYDLSESALRLCDCSDLLEETYYSQTPLLAVLEADAIFSDANPHKDAYALPTNLIEDIFPIFHYHIFYKAYLPDFIVKKDVMLRTENMLKGYVQTDMAVPYEGEADYMGIETKARIQSDSLKYLTKIHEFCRDNNIELLITAVPCPKLWNIGKHRAMSEWADENGVDFLDMNLLLDEIGIDWQMDTMDGGNHVSFEGSKKVTAFMGNYLKTHYSLEDHRGDSYYENWNEALEESELYP